MKALDDDKVNMIDLFLYILVSSYLNMFCLLAMCIVCFNFFPKRLKGVLNEVIYICIKGLDGRISDCKLKMHAK